MEKAFQDLDDWLNTSDMPNGKKKVLKAALRLFSEQGYDGTSTAQIAEASGMSQATIFKYFKSKDDLLLFIIEPIIDHILPTYGESFAKEIKTVNQDLEGIVDFIIQNRYQFLVQNKDAAFILLSQVMINDHIKTMLLNKFSSLKDIFLENVWKTLKDTGEMRDDIDILSLVRLMASQIIFYFLQSQRILKNDDSAQVQKDLNQIEKMILRAIRK